MHPKVVQKRLGYSNIAVTIYIYSHVIPGLQEMAARKIERAIGAEVLDLLAGNADGGTMAAT